MTIEGKSVLVTGSNRGTGQALVDEALRRGAERVYTGSRQPLTHPDGRATPVVLDVTGTDQVCRVADQVKSLDILVNNAGIAIYDNLSDRSVLEQHLAVNLFGAYEVTHALLPQLSQSRGTIVNNISMMAMAPLPSGEEDIFPDVTSQALAASWRASVAKGLEHQYAAFVPAA